MKPPVVLKGIGVALFAAAALAAVVALVQASTYLDGMKAGRTTLLLSTVAQPLMNKPFKTWTTTERKGMDLALKLALREGEGSTSSLEYAERYVQKLGMSDKTFQTVHSLRCEAAKNESLWTWLPRQLPKAVARDPVVLAPCTGAALPVAADEE